MRAATPHAGQKSGPRVGGWVNLSVRRQCLSGPDKDRGPWPDPNPKDLWPGDALQQYVLTNDALPCLFLLAVAP